MVIETNVKDGDGVWWKAGPRETIMVKSYDGSVRQQGGRARN